LHVDRRINLSVFELRRGMESDGEANWGRLNKPNRHIREDRGLESQVLNPLRLLPGPLWIGIAGRIRVVFSDEGLLCTLKRVAPFLPGVDQITGARRVSLAAGPRARYTELASDGAMGFPATTALAMASRFRSRHRPFPGVLPCLWIEGRSALMDRTLTAPAPRVPAPVQRSKTAFGGTVLKCHRSARPALMARLDVALSD